MSARLLYRTGAVVATSGAAEPASCAEAGAGPVVEVAADARCPGCAVGCTVRRRATISLAAVPGLRLGERVLLTVPARALNRQCAALFGPWLLVVGVLIGLGARGTGVDPTFGVLALALLLALALGAALVRADAHAVRPCVERVPAVAGEPMV